MDRQLLFHVSGHTPSQQLLESLLLKDGELFLLDEHLTRLNQSAKYFGYPFKEEDVKSTLLHCAEQHLRGEYKVRLLLDKSGETHIEAQALQLPKEPLKGTLADMPLHKDNIPFCIIKQQIEPSMINFEKVSSSF